MYQIFVCRIVLCSELRSLWFTRRDEAYLVVLLVLARLTDVPGGQLVVVSSLEPWRQLSHLSLILQHPA